MRAFIRRRRFMAGIIENFMAALFACDALLPSGWARDVLVEWDGAGIVSSVVAGAAPGLAARAAGPLLPGIANVHSHAFQRAIAGLAEFRGHPTDDFWTWREEMYRLVQILTPEDVEAIARHLYIEMLKHGYTTVAEFHYLHNDLDGRPYADKAEMANRIVGAAAESRIALTLLPVLYAHGGLGHRVLSRAQKRFGGDPAFVVKFLRWVAALHLPNPLRRLGVAPHSVRAVDALLLTELVDAVAHLDATMPIHMHVSEQVGEVTECVETHGTTPLAWVMELVEVGERWCFIHATHLTQIEMRALGRRADFVVLDGEDIDLEGLRASAALGVAIFSGNSNRVRDVFVGGAPVVENRRHAAEDSAARAFRSTLKRLRATS